MKQVLLSFCVLISFGFQAQSMHNVKAKETVYGIAKQYNISQEDLLKANPEIQTNGLQIGMEIKIPGNNGNFANNKEFQVVQEDQDFVYLKIQPKQTLYSIGKAFNIPINQIQQHNPNVSNGLKIGDLVKIPKRDHVPVSIQSNNKNNKSNTVQLVNDRAKRYYNDFVEHKIKRGETIYSLMVKYDVGLKDILEYNPNLAETGLVVGQIVKIPVGINPNQLPKYNDGKINLALLLPFQIGNNDSKKLRNVALDFLTGANIALDSLAQQGKNIELQVFDTEKNKIKIKEFVQNNSPNQIDAIIGPLYGNLVAELANNYKENYVPIFSPKNNDEDLEAYNNVYLSNTRDKDLANEVVEEIKTQYAGEQILILTDNDDEELAKYTKKMIEDEIKEAKTLLTKNINDLVQPSELVTETLEDGSKFEQEYFTPIITVLVSNDNTLGKSYTNKIFAMNPDNLKAFGIKYVSSYDMKKQSNVKKLYDIGFAYSTDRLVNVYGKKEQRLMQKFKKACCSNPNSYQQLGFDLVYDVVDRMNENGLLIIDNNKKTKRFSGNYQYQKGQQNAFVNKAVLLVKFYKNKPKAETNNIEAN